MQRSVKRLGTDFEIYFENHNKLSEVAVWDESPWNEARWADDKSSAALEDILKIISSGSFPKTRSGFNEGQRHQLRDAMILEAHANCQRDVFVSDGLKAYISHGKREKLENICETKILSTVMFNEYLTIKCDI